MKAKFKYYIVIWAILVAAFNIIVFVSPNQIGGLSKFSGSFWIGYTFITVAFIMQLAVTWYSIKDDNLTKTFYNIPLISVSIASLVIMIIVGSICMVIPNFPKWLGVILCFIVLGITFIMLMPLAATSEVVSGIDKKIKEKTLFINSLVVDIEALISQTSSHEIKTELEKVYESARYSDPMSSDALSKVESQIVLKLNKLAKAVDKNDVESVSENAKDMVILLKDRNKKCQLLK